MLYRQIRFNTSVGAPAADGVAPSERTFFDVPMRDDDGNLLHPNNIAPDQHLASIEDRGQLIILTNAKGDQRVTPLSNMKDARPLVTAERKKGAAA